MEENKEKRLTDEASLKTKETETTEETKQSKVISGYALKFGKASKDLRGFTEVITAEALKGVDLYNVFLLQNHDYSKPLVCGYCRKKQEVNRSVYLESTSRGLFNRYTYFI